MATPSAALMAQLRRMIAEPTEATYTTAMLVEVLARYPLNDVNGYAPDNTLWAGAWDINQAAADLWEEKAAACVADFDFSADGGDYKRSQAQAQMLTLAARYRARRKPKSLVLKVEPSPYLPDDLRLWIGNLPERLEEWE